MREEVANALQAFKEQFLNLSKPDGILTVASPRVSWRKNRRRATSSVLLANRGEQDLDDDMILREVAFYAGRLAQFRQCADPLLSRNHTVVRYSPGGSRTTNDRRCIPATVRSRESPPASCQRGRLAHGQRTIHLGGWHHIPAGGTVIIDLMSANLEPELFGRTQPLSTRTARSPIGYRPSD
ncbi:MAG: hypothetical protein CM15mP84_05540 [Cellvibrionales bacterium]|nr:MAG: hypothetical protein CM15mP84_05540 [Cellvibrionales bacterium]